MVASVVSHRRRRPRWGGIARGLQEDPPGNSTAPHPSPARPGSLTQGRRGPPTPPPEGMSCGGRLPVRASPRRRSSARRATGLPDSSAACYQPAGNAHRRTCPRTSPQDQSRPRLVPEEGASINRSANARSRSCRQHGGWTPPSPVLARTCGFRRARNGLLLSGENFYGPACGRPRDRRRHGPTRLGREGTPDWRRHARDEASAETRRALWT